MTAPSAAVRLVMGRELRTRMRSRSFLLSNAVVLVLIVGGIVLGAVLTRGGDHPDSVGVVGGASSLSSVLTSTGTALGNPVTVRGVASADAARTAISDGDLDVALVPGVGGARCVRSPRTWWPGR